MDNPDMKYKHFLRDAFILLGSMMSVMAGATIAPALPEMARYFGDQPDSEFLVKIMLTVPSLFIALLSPFAGMGIDRFGRKVMLLPAIALYGIAGVSGFFLNDLYLILIGRAFLGVSVAVIMAGFITLIGDYFEGERLNKFMGLQAAFISFAGVIFLFFSGLLAEIEWRHPFLMYFFAFLIFPGVALFVKEPPREQSSESRAGIPFRMLMRAAGWIFALAFLLQAIFLVVPVQLPFVFSEAGISNTKMGISLSFWIFCSAVISIFYKKFRTMFSFNSIYIIAFLMWAVGYFLVASDMGYWVMMAGLLLAGAGNGLALPNIKVHLLSKVGPEYRGRAVGLLTMFFYFGQFVSPIIFTLILIDESIQSGFAILGGFMAAMCIVFFIVKK
ncbi:MAG: MFS transporter [Bacteroidota bacterium]